MSGGVWRVFAAACFAFAGLVPASAFSADPPDMSFRAVPVMDEARCAPRCDLVIEANGKIKRETPQAFAQFLRANERNIASGALRPVVVIDSPGGDVAGSMLLGLMFRELQATVIVGRAPRSGSMEAANRTTLNVSSGECYSACVYSLVGGRARVVPPVSRVGVHQMHRHTDLVAQVFQGQPSVLPATNGSVRMLDEYIRRMGVNPELVTIAQRVPHDRIHQLSANEMRRLKVIAGRP